MTELYLIVRAFWPLLLGFTIGLIILIIGKRRHLDKTFIQPAITLTIGFGVLNAFFVGSALYLNFASHFGTAQHQASAEVNLARGITAWAGVLPAFPYWGFERPKTEFDDEDSVNLAVWINAKKVHGKCPIHPGDLKISVSAPAFTVGSALPDSSNCVTGWQSVLSPLHRGLQTIEVGLVFAPTWLSRPEEKVLHMAIRIHAPRPFWEDPMAPAIAGGAFTLLGPLFTVFWNWKIRKKSLASVASATSPLVQQLSLSDRFGFASLAKSRSERAWQRSGRRSMTRASSVAHMRTRSAREPDEKGASV